VVVTTEGFDGRFSLDVPRLRDRWQRYAREHDQALIVTAYTVEPNGWKGNAVGAIDRRGRLVGIHRKVDLALEGEKMLARGSGYEVFRLDPELVLGVPLCLESVLPAAPHTMARLGATLLAASTSDITFGSNVTGFEHLATTELRAIEVGRSIVWASNGGPSGVIDRWGVFESAAPFRGVAAARVRAQLATDSTFYLAHSSAVVVMAALALLIALGATRGRSSGLAEALALRDQTRRTSGLSSAALGLGALAGGLLVIGASPALVESSHGATSRAWKAVKETFRRPLVYVPPDPFTRFRTPPTATASGAIAYFLAYYGVEVSADSIAAALPSAPSLEQAKACLEARFELRTRRIPVDAARLPRVAALVRARDGSFGVLSDPGGDGHASLFSPVTGGTTLVDHSRLDELTDRSALVPE
jgi:hypothetical protein